MTVRLPELWRDTVAALLAPRRAAAIAALGLPVLAAQAAWNLDPVSGVAAGALLIAGTLAFAPFAWRAASGHAHGLDLYGLACLLIAGLFGLVLPRALGVEDRFLTQLATAPVIFGLVAVGGYGLGRDIDDERRLVRLQADKERAELLALRAQLDPHFLFNTLGAIAEWCHSDPAEAERAILRLCDLLRGVQAGVREASWPLSREISLCRDVLELYRARDPGRYAYHIEVQGADVPVPPLILLPVVENAIKHGPAAGHAGQVRVVVRDNGGAGVIVEVRNPGPLGPPREGGQGIALTRRRLALAYDEDLAQMFGLRQVQDETVAWVYLGARPREAA